MKAQNMRVFAWGLSGLVILLALITWVQGYGGEIETISPYLLFPVLGLVAFSVMWTHYIVGALRRLSGVERTELKSYFAVTGWVALICILLHPSLLIFQLWRDGLGLPPGSYLTYVGPALKWAVMLGTLSFLIFLSFETKKWFKGKGWWPVVEYANVVAMFAVLAHSLALGRNLQSGWFRWVWIMYGVTLVIALAYLYYQEAKQAKAEGVLMKKVVGIVAVVVVVLGISGFAYMQLNKDSGTTQKSSTASSGTQTTPTPTDSQNNQTYTLAEVQTHNSASDCWTVIDGMVYNITSYIPRHPGGDDILRACGVDATTMFTQRQDANGNDIGSGTPHSSNAGSQLAQFQVGVLAQ